MTRLNNLQVLRAVAAFWVVLLHTELYILGWRVVGGFGVDIFFVISGFIMARICITDSQKFFVRRLVRIVPLYWAATIVIFAIAMLAPSLLHAAKTSSIELVKSLLFIPFRKGSGKIQPLLFVGWTLNYEMFFYVALAIGLRVDRRRAVLFAAFLIALTIGITSIYRADSVICEFYSEPLSLEFLMGMGLFFATRNVERFVPYRRLLLPISALSLVALIVAESLEWTAPWVRPFALGIPAVLLVGSATLLSSLRRDTKVAFLVLLGDSSYALYVVHQYVQMGIARTLAPRLPSLQMNTPLGATVAVGSAVAVGIAVHLIFEKPLTQWLNRKIRRGARKVERIPVAANIFDVS